MLNYYFLGLANQTADFNGSRIRTERLSSEEKVLFFYWKNTQKEKNSALMYSEFSDLLKLQNLSLLKSYLKTHRLSESDEYQMVVTVAMELEDDEVAEKIICGYIRRYGLCSLKAKQALKDLGFQKALRILNAQEIANKSDEPLDLCEEPYSVYQRLRDGFEMMRDDENLSI